jgi:hypothetical protein
MMSLESSQIAYMQERLKVDKLFGNNNKKDPTYTKFVNLKNKDLTRHHIISQNMLRHYF